MNKFLKKLTLFFILPIICISLFIAILQFINYNLACSKQLDNSIKTVFIGDSHIEHAINDSLLQNSINIAQSSESLYFTYYKLKIVLKQNPSIKNVYLGFGKHSISSYFDKFIFGEYSNAISSKFFFILPTNEKMKIMVANKNSIFSYLKIYIKNGFLNLFITKKTFQGGYENTFEDTKATEESINNRVNFQYFTEGEINNYSSLNIEYLNKINDLCKNSNVKLVLINTPIYSYYKNKIPHKFNIKYDEIIKKNNLETIDLSDLLNEDYYFYNDGDHVSKKGANETTKYLKQMLKL